MDIDILLPAMPAIAGLSFAALIVFVIAAIQESKHGANTAETVKRGYLYLVSFVTLLIASAALVSLLDTGLRAVAFTRADVLPAYKAMPPGLYLTPEKVEPAASVPVNGLSCTTGCTLTTTQKLQVSEWEAAYRDWQKTADRGYQRSQSLVTSLSFFIVALIVFLFHWLLARRDRTAGQVTAMRITHLWAVSFIMIIASVVSAGFLLNTTLKTVLLKGEVGNSVQTGPVPAIYDRSGVDSLVTCGGPCGLSNDTVTLAQQWQTDYAAYTTSQREGAAARNRDNNFAKEIAFLIVALPLFFYHFRTVWKETRGLKDPTPPATLV